MKEVYFAYTNIDGDIVIINHFPFLDTYKVSKEDKVKCFTSPKEAFEFGGTETLLGEE